MHQISDSSISNYQVPTCDCKNNPIGCLEQMFVQMVQKQRIDQGQSPARRPVFLRLHGVAHGCLEILPNIPGYLKVGIFKTQQSYPVWVRYASDLKDGIPDLKSTVGIGIKVFDVPGKKILHPDEHAPTIDFILQNIDVFFVDNAREMCEFTKASLTSQDEFNKWLKAHPRTEEILEQMKKVVPSVLDTELWSCIPFNLGSNCFWKQHCKYKLVPYKIPEGSVPNYDDPNYLHNDLKERLLKGEARFKFLVQLQKNTKTMPLDQATVLWDETASPPIHVATLILPSQDITSRGQAEYGETLSFNPWRTLEAHKPVGSIADVRKVVYEASAKLRRNVNGEPIGEPQESRAKGPYPPAKDDYIVRAAIYPGIGVARVGNSTTDDGYYIQPEVLHPVPVDMRDATGAIKRQAARFRIYGYNAAGEIVRELNSTNADIQWTVHIANRKAEWYQFQAALDIPETEDMSVPLRNSDVPQNERKGLAIDPGPRTITGPNKSGADYQFDTGTFTYKGQTTVVPLGELRTDELGHLLVLGGFGKSASPTGQPIYDPQHKERFNNAEGWYDDTSDGPVTAKVNIAGREIPVESGWVIVGPPNYAPEIVGWRTLYDLLVDTYIESGWMAMPTKASFNKDILPVLSRLTNLQWVNKGFATLFGSTGNGCTGNYNFDDPNFIAQLAQQPQGNRDEFAELRRTIFNYFRQPYSQSNERSLWPQIYGDAFGTNYDSSPRNNLALSKVRMELMKLWVNGDFVNDWNRDYQPPSNISQVPLAEQPDMLNQASLNFCLADAFHPGCEVTWPMRHATLYTAPFRVRHRDVDEPEPNYGPSLTPAIALQPGGPLSSQGPGDLTRWMALPWQGDTAYCRSGYDIKYDPYIPTFWPARVPNHVLTQKNYQILMDGNLSVDHRLAAYNSRDYWLRMVTMQLIGQKAKPSIAEQMERMVHFFGKMGIIERRPGPKDLSNYHIPTVVFVENLTEASLIEMEQNFVPTLDSRQQSQAEQAGWQSEEELREILAIKGINNKQALKPEN